MIHQPLIGLVAPLVAPLVFLGAIRADASRIAASTELVNFFTRYAILLPAFRERARESGGRRGPESLDARLDGPEYHGPFGLESCLRTIAVSSSHVP